MALCAEPGNERNGGKPFGQAPLPVGSGVHGFDLQGAGRIPSAGESPHYRGNAGRSQTAIRGAEVIRP